jgi:hypothetical protein
LPSVVRRLPSVPAYRCLPYVQPHRNLPTHVSNLPGACLRPSLLFRTANSIHIAHTTANMADVNMTDAPAAKAKVAKAGAGADGDKKRFEVKKVRHCLPTYPRITDS